MSDMGIYRYLRQVKMVPSILTAAYPYSRCGESNVFQSRANTPDCQNDEAGKRANSTLRICNERYLPSVFRCTGHSNSADAHDWLVSTRARINGRSVE